MRRDLEIRVFESLGFASACWDKNGHLEIQKILDEGEKLITWIETNYEPRQEFI